MQVVRVRLQRFRGFESAEFFPQGHVCLAGEPRAGRSDLIRAMIRVLDSGSTRLRIDPLDVHLPLPSLAEDEELPLTEVEVTLVDLGHDLEQLLDGRMEAIDLETGAPADSTTAGSAVMGIRICYRLRFDESTGEGSHWVDYPKLSDPATGVFVRVPRIEREALPFVAVRHAEPLQLRAEGLLRQLIDDGDSSGLADALDALNSGVATATSELGDADVVKDQIREVLAVGAELLLRVPGAAPEDSFSFLAEDGSVTSLLRAIQPAIELDGAGALPLLAHGSTVRGVLAASESAVSAGSSNGVVVIDDFGDDLDSASAEFLAARLRRSVGQLWISTRRPDAMRAFLPEEIARLTGAGPHRSFHQLSPTADRKERGARRQLGLLLLPAITARTVVLLEGPHDLEGYGAIADRRLRVKGHAPPAAHGMRLLAPPGNDGGKEKLLPMAKLAGSLGFKVRVVLDNDDPVKDAPLIEELKKVTELVVRLPAKTAVERALVAGLPTQTIRDTLTWLSSRYGLGIDVSKVLDSDLELTAIKAIKSKGGLHQPWVDALPKQTAPPIAISVLTRVVDDVPASGPLIEIDPV